MRSGVTPGRYIRRVSRQTRKRLAYFLVAIIAAALDTHGGYGFAAEYDVERKFRETRLLLVAPVSNNLVLAYLGQNVLGMPRSY